MPERFVELSNGHRIWTNTLPGGPGLPLIVVHGGPGTGHDYLENYEALTPDRPVVFYDQLGCGRSDHPDNLSLWRIERFADEVDELRAALGLKECHILGQSWGGMLAIEYLVRRPPGVRAAILASTCASIGQMLDTLKPMIATLSGEDQASIGLHIRNGTFSHPDFQRATEHFYKRYLCLLDPFPDCILRTMANVMRSPSVMPLMGPTEFDVLGNMRYWDRISDLGLIGIPTLVTCGILDYLSRPNSETIVNGIPGSRLVVFENSSHSSHIEETEANLASVGGFLREHDPQPAIHA